MGGGTGRGDCRSAWAYFLCFFFFQAEDGIRDISVTGVQTCALPIYNVLSQLDLPRIPIDEGTATTAGISALVAVLVVTLVAAILGGLLGARYHRKVDKVGFDH